MTTAAIRSAIETLAGQHGLSPDLVEAVVLAESGGNTYATRPEPTYRYLVTAKTGQPFRFLSSAEAASKTPPADFRALTGSAAIQEWWGQQSSWGLMQVMGAVARELGFREPFFAALTEPLIGLHYGCTHLARQLRWSKGDVNQALAAYNAGRGGWKSEQAQGYVVKVTDWLAQIEGASTRRA